ncbi:MAG: hypothetical protein ACTJHC_02855 [Vagococcus sp.]
MDKRLKKISALGVPSIVLIVAVSVSGVSGAVGVLVALSSLGPFGIPGGILTLGLIGVISATITKYGTEFVIKAVVKEQLKKMTKDDIVDVLIEYPISEGLKLKVIEYVENV